MSQVICLYTGPDNRSAFADNPLALQSDSVGRLTTGLQGARAWIYMESPNERFVDWHTSGAGGVSVILAGWMEVEVGSGDKRRLTTGDVLLALDTVGQGHRSTMSAGSRGLSLVFDRPAAEVMQALFGRALV